jgi:hypothetical protein
MGNKLIDRASQYLARRTDRRGFLTKIAVIGSAIAVAPLRYMLRPQSAYATVCSCSGSSCNCTDLCCDGYTEFCCTINGTNSCPPGTVAAGWWKADGSGFCRVDGVDQPRYYIDCNTGCNGCGCGSSGLCSRGCASCNCGCANGSCNNRKSCCTSFRYGQCNNQIRCVGPIVCRVITCTPPWQWEPTCSTASATDNFTRFHNRPCLQGDNPMVARAGVVRGTQWLLGDVGGGPAADGFDFGEDGDIFLMGDWNGDGIMTPGVVRGARFGAVGGPLTWMLKNSNGPGEPDFVFEFGEAGDIPVVGDWGGAGAHAIGVFRNGRWQLKSNLETGPGESDFIYGEPGDIPIVGDWNADGIDTIGVRRGSEWRLRNSNNAGAPHITFFYANPDDTPIVGDWDGDGVDTVGVFRDGQWLVRNSHRGGDADQIFYFGTAGDHPVVWGDNS